MVNTLKPSTDNCQLYSYFGAASGAEITQKKKEKKSGTVSFFQYKSHFSNSTLS